jgi:hypothetical protein
MSTIKISDLHPTGSELFSDSESYMNELSNSEFETIAGGITPTTPACAAGAVFISRAVAVRTWAATVRITARATRQDPGASMPGGWGEISRMIF